MGFIETTLAAIESLESGESINHGEIEKKYSVERSTLSRRHRAKTQSRGDAYEN
ncbi:hypothetical protein CC78DRAFT_481059 [Lojkania enalia]|uniref:HTH psq-type domain-containing protein n=1 Tax=Lojkania enalia TaxID=147567 RepID=A0A9P4K0F5_9PLEO|nr:hypothetical protein CC78DRAFT_481059 [Didymosphaeria enalia]